MAPSILEFNLLNQTKGQFYALVEIQLRNALFLFIDGNILPIISDDNLIKVKFPIKSDQSNINIKAKGLIGSRSKSISVSPNSNVVFNTIAFGRIGQISNKRISTFKTKPSIRMEDLLLAKDIKIKNEEPLIYANQLHLKSLDYDKTQSLQEIDIINQIHEIELELKNHILHEK